MPVEPSVHMVTFRRVYMQRLERGSCMQVKISKEACALGDNWNEWGELSWSSLTAKKTKTSSSQIQIIGHLWGLLFVRVGIVQSVSLSFYRLCLGTVIRARGGDRKEKKKTLNLMSLSKRNSLTSSTGPFPLTLPSYVSTSSTLCHMF